MFILEWFLTLDFKETIFYIQIMNTIHYSKHQENSCAPASEWQKWQLQKILIFGSIKPSDVVLFEVAQKLPKQLPFHHLKHSKRIQTFFVQIILRGCKSIRTIKIEFIGILPHHKLLFFLPIHVFFCSIQSLSHLELCKTWCFSSSQDLSSSNSFFQIFSLYNSVDLPTSWSTQLLNT